MLQLYAGGNYVAVQAKFSKIAVRVPVMPLLWGGGEYRFVKHRFVTLVRLVSQSARGCELEPIGRSVGRIEWSRSQSPIDP